MSIFAPDDDMGPPLGTTSDDDGEPITDPGTGH